MDEPSNHLDIDSQEVLEAALAGFGGTILLVSHDRYLVDALATQIWEITPGEIKVVDGDYQEYLRQRKRATQQDANAKVGAAPARPGKNPAVYREKQHGLNPFELAKHTAALEEKIQTLETSLHEISQQLDDASLAGDADAVRRLGIDYSNTEAMLEAALEEWGRYLG